jgi:hypothetical protein
MFCDSEETMTVKLVERYYVKRRGLQENTRLPYKPHLVWVSLWPTGPNEPQK